MVKNSQTTRFGLLRHAQTVWNQEKRIQGQKDSPINPKGREQAAGWGRILKTLSWDRIISSDSGRAVQTALIINNFLRVPVLQDTRLREQDWGIWTGKSIDEIDGKSPQWLADRAGTGWRFCPPGGEDRFTVWKRSQQALKEAAEKWPQDTILIVTHEGVIKSLVYQLYGRKFLPSESQIIRPYHLHWLSGDSDNLRVAALNALSLNF
ncbi:MAG: histidine phosphatase family protein [Deltaproteobacteria bacterium]|nr:MAG: histidine phosphatase family protein [Deltaproteobacteria bacterium]